MANNQSKVKYLAKNTALFTISSFCSKLITFFLVPFYTNVLTTEDYGRADLLSTSVSLLLFIFSLNVAAAVLRFAMEYREKSRGILLFGLNVFVIGYFLLIVVTGFIAYLDFLEIENNIYLYLLLLYLVCGLNELLSNYLRSQEKINIIVIASIITTLTIVGSNIFCLLVLDMGVNGYLFSMVLGNATSCVIYSFACSGHKIKQEKVKDSVKKEMLIYSIPLIFNGVAWWISQSVDKYFIVTMLGPGQNGIYAVASKISTILSTLLVVFMQAWNLSAIKEYQKEGSEKFYSDIYKVFNFFLVVSASVLIFLNIPIAKLLFAKEFFIAWECSTVLVLAGIFSGMSSFLGSFFSAAKKSSAFAISTIIASIVNCVLNASLIPVYGILGAAIATAISFFVVWLIRLVCVKKYVSIKISFYRDIVSYILLVLQIYMQHKKPHDYLIQCLILLVIFILNVSTFKMLVNTIKGITILKQSKK